MTNLKLCVFSDIHYIKEKPNWSVNQKLTEYAEEFVSKIVDKVNNEIKPDICIHLGDMIQASQSEEIDIQNIKYIWQKLNNFSVPFYTLLGNHELKNVQSNKEILKIIGYSEATFSFDINGYHLLFLGTDVNFTDYKYRTQYLSDRDLKWIENDLKINVDKKTIVFSHFGIAEDDMKGNFWFENDIESGMIRNREYLKKMLVNHKNLIGVFVGHQHWTKKIEEAGINYYMVGSLVENINSDGIPDGVFLEIEIDNDYLNIVEKHLCTDNIKNGYR
ncbi:MAG: hypothetical protein HFI86_05220 [Bacilli bacterium]|nr:hypothetical protein [Bacilli bacterium]